MLAPVAHEIHRHWRTGDPAREIMRLATEHDADAIVVGPSAAARWPRQPRIPMNATELPRTPTH
uniref:hypothetical protein n=1 Tax=Cupriavidus ulmosensis TaxID=3065913 RepID=UPI003F849174